MADNPNAVMVLAVATVGSEDFEQAVAGLRSDIAALSPSQKEGPSSVLGELLPFVESVAAGPRVLLVGIDQGPARIASRNVEIAARWLKNVLGLAGADIRILLNNDATDSRILEHFQRLAKASRYRTGVFSYSGYGWEFGDPPTIAHAGEGDGINVSELASLAGEDTELLSFFNFYRTPGRKPVANGGNHSTGERGKREIRLRFFGEKYKLGEQRSPLASRKRVAVVRRLATGESISVPTTGPSGREAFEGR